MADQGLPVWDINLVLDKTRLLNVLKTSGGSRGITDVNTNGLKGLILSYIPSKTELDLPKVKEAYEAQVLQIALLKGDQNNVLLGDVPRIRVGRLEVVDGKFKANYSSGEGLPWEVSLNVTIQDNETLVLYNGTSEFDLAFFPYHVVIGLLNYSKSTTKGLRITRGLITYPLLTQSLSGSTGTSYYKMQSYRTLTARPEKDPVQPKVGEASFYSVSHDEALSVYYAPPCPPIWEEEGLAMHAYGLATKAKSSNAAYQSFPPTRFGFFKLLRLSVASVIKPAWRRFVVLNSFMQRVRRFFELFD